MLDSPVMSESLDMHYWNFGFTTTNHQALILLVTNVKPIEGVAGLRQLTEHPQHFCSGRLLCIRTLPRAGATRVTAGVQGLQTDRRAAENRKNSCDNTARRVAGVLAFHPLSEDPKWARC